MVFIPETKKFSGKTFTQMQGLYTKAAADKEADKLKKEGYLVRKQGVREGTVLKYRLYIRPSGF